MKTKAEITRLTQEIEDIKRQLLELGPVHPGSISSQYHACGKRSCRCHDPDNPVKHGPYTKLTYARKGKVACRFVRPDSVDELSRRIGNYRTLRRLIDRWIELSVQTGTIDFFRKPEKAPQQGNTRPS